MTQAMLTILTCRLHCSVEKQFQRSMLLHRQQALHVCSRQLEFCRHCHERLGSNCALKQAPHVACSTSLLPDMPEMHSSTQAWGGNMRSSKGDEPLRFDAMSTGSQASKFSQRRQRSSHRACTCLPELDTAVACAGMTSGCSPGSPTGAARGLGPADVKLAPTAPRSSFTGLLSATVVPAAIHVRQPQGTGSKPPPIRLATS